MAKRYHRDNQNPYIEEEQTTQWPKDTTGVIRIRISKKNRQHNGQPIPQGSSESIYRRRTDNTMTKRYQKGNQNPYIEEEPTTQWPKDTTGVIRIRQSNEEQTKQWPKDTTGVIRVVYRRRTDNTMAKRYHRGHQNPHIEEEQKTQ